MPPTFGRIDILRGSSVEITEIIDYTKRHENRCVGANGDVLSTLTFGRSDTLILIYVAFFVTFMCVRVSELPYITNKITHPASQRIARSLPTRPIFLFASLPVLPVCPQTLSAIISS